MKTADRIELDAQSTGRGRPLVFVHGWTMSKEFYVRQVEGLSRDFRVITYDLRGHGDSGSSRTGNTIEQAAKDLQAVLEAEKVRDCVLVGWSLGCSVVIDHWRQFGNERVGALAIVEGTPYPMAPDDWNTHRLRGKGEVALDISINAFKSDREGFGKAFIKGMFADAPPKKQTLGWMMDEYRKADTPSAARLYRDYAKCDLREILATISVPTLAAYGTGGSVHFGHKTGEHVASTVPNAELKLFENSGHMPFYQEPDAFNASLRRLAARIP